ncbi:hypothetical protein [Gemmatimonas sp.]|jgi:ATP-dependent HslUV protease ATP-binding subunit HslU|uniref:hypothetical protein n=1 Tax=Gemmatimonas sp. TaxID=1962908 RepID=UPI0037C14443
MHAVDVIVAALTFEPDGIAEIARVATRVNERMKNIGVRRRHTVLTTLLDDALYELPDRGKDAVSVDAAMVGERPRRSRKTRICARASCRGTPD